MFRKIVLFILLVISEISYAQGNLVMNPSFEDVNVNSLCGFGGFNQGMNFWNLPTSHGSSDILHLIYDLSCSYHPINNNQLPRTGNSMAGFSPYVEIDEYREYIQGELLTPLLPNRSYQIKFYLSLNDQSTVGIKNIGIKFNDSLYYIETNENIPEVPDVEYNENVIIDNENWVEVNLNFTPTVANLKYFIIGNFNRDEHTIIDQFSPEYMPDFCYYLIDDVSISVAPLQFDQLGPFCQDTDFTLPITSIDGISGTWSPAINTQQTTNYTFTPNNSVEDLPSVQMTVEIIPKVKATFEEFAPICYGSLDFNLPSISQNNISGVWDKAFNNIQTDTYVFTPNHENCVETTEVTIKILPAIELEIFTYCKNEVMYVESKHASKSLKFEWYLNENLLNSTSNNVIIDYNSDIFQEFNTLKIIVKDENSCISEKVIENFKILPCNIQKGISSNGDYLNEYFNLHYFGGVDLKIFNRYGTIVYEKKNYKVEWYGQSNKGNTLPSGTYYYTIKTRFGEEWVGWIQLVTESN